MTKHDELRALLDRLNSTDHKDAAKIVTEVLKYLMDSMKLEEK